MIWRRIDLWLLAAAALALIPIAAILQPDMPRTADGVVHLLRTLEVSQLLRAGVLYPRWAPDFYLGYGYPFFVFYAPGAHLVAAWLALTGLGIVRGVVIVQALALLLYPTGAYLAAHSLFDGQSSTTSAARSAALVSAALYLYAPLRFRELFIQGNLSQLLALALLPWCAWLLIRAIRRADPLWSVAAGLALAALVYAHHPSAFLGFPFLAAFAGGLALMRPQAWRGIVAGVGAFTFGTLLSAPFWLPAIVELRDVNIASISTGMFNARLNLLPLGELLAPARVLDDTALNPAQPNSLGLAQALLALAGTFAAFRWVVWPARSPSAYENTPGLWTRRQRGGALLMAAGLWLLSLALMLPVAAPVWERLPLASFIAFPWRLLGPALLWAALLGGAALLALPAAVRTAAALVCVLLIPLAIAPYLFPRPFAPMTEPGLADLAAYELQGGARATASANEYLPRWVLNPDPPTDLAEAMRRGSPYDRLDAGVLPAGSRVEQLAGGPLDDRYRLDLPVATTVTLLRFYFPGWEAWVDGQLTAIRPSTPYGFISVPVGAGQHELHLHFGATPARNTGAALGLVGLLAVAGTLGIFFWRRRQPDAAMAGVGLQRPAWRWDWLAPVSIVLLTLVTTLWVGPATRWFRERSPIAAPAAMQQPLHLRFANGMELIGYDLWHAPARQGETLDLRLYWRALEPQQANSRPFVHLDALTLDLTWANQTKTHPGDKPSKGWPLEFYVVDDYRLEIPVGTPAGVGLLRAGLLDENDELIPLSDGSELAALRPVRVLERRPLSGRRLPGNAQTYRLGPAIHLVGHAVTPVRPAAGSALSSAALDVTLYWQAKESLPADYTVFVHVLNAEGERIAQADGQPLAGRYPTRQWLPGQVIADVRRVNLPEKTELMGVTVAVGLYRPEDGVRLVTADRRGTRLANDQILLRLEGR